MYMGFYRNEKVLAVRVLELGDDEWVVVFHKTGGVEGLKEFEVKKGMKAQTLHATCTTYDEGEFEMWWDYHAPISFPRYPLLTVQEHLLASKNNAVMNSYF